MLDIKHWWQGVVEDVNDPDQNGRVAVRIFGVHTTDTSLLPTDMLPWAKILMPPTNASSVGLGWSPTGLTVGSHVAGFATDDAYQEIRVAWVWSGSNPTNGADTNPLALGQVVQAIDRQAYNAVTDVPVKEETDEPTPPTPPSSIDPEKWMSIARGEIGVKEYSGKFNNNPRIIEYHKTTSLGASEDEVSWCASFVGWCLLKAGYTSTKSALARSYMSWGVALSEPRYGAIVVFRRGNNPTFGHVTFVQKFDSQYLYCLGGNQSDQVKVSRFPRSSVLGYRWPAGDTLVSNEPKSQNGKWSEPIPDRTPKTVPTPPPSGRVQDQETFGADTVPTSGGSQYPYNNVFASRSGHVIEVDDTPDGERLHWLHRSGSYKQMLSTGDVVRKTVRNDFDITMFDKRYMVGKDHNLTVGGTEVQRKAGASYHLYQDQYSNVVNGPSLYKFAGLIEYHVGGILRFMAQNIEMSGTLKLPKLLVGEIIAQKLTVQEKINGNIIYADMAGTANSKGGATPASPSGPGDITINAQLQDTGGNFDKPIEGDGASSGAVQSKMAADTSSPAQSTANAQMSSIPTYNTLPDASTVIGVVVLKVAGQKPVFKFSDGSSWEDM
ncbi:baseplate hub subunit and tail lysozyme [Serratia phage vB_SmaA_3M]|uniref:Putative baseplate hub subunit and tail lysozyme n=1 Tax=Serratia phage vB_SmaA_3M TaxID=2419930 RepID=A0A3G2YS97_9CAUD|nr:baseplate hub subunit and tail lysozyme [Serratia phage vB_SmaA_3M]AYP28396.1 putative baseplate hub subunit and tail lysozyme [Serratia phage vB_SmaA_3M]